MNDLARLAIAREQSQGPRPLARRARRWALWLLVLGALGAAGYQAERAGLLERRHTVELGTVSTAVPTQGFTLFTATGYVVPQTRADVASKATGRLKSLEVEEGSRVRSGEVIARLEDEDVMAVMARAQANVAVARAELGQAEAELKDAEVALTRSKSMLAKNFTTAEAHDVAVARRDKALAGVRIAEAAILAADAALEEARVAVEYTLIRAPFDGVILKKYADIGDVVAPFAATTESKGAVASMADLATLQVEADVSESNLTQVRTGQPCEVQLDALPGERYAAEVAMIVPTVDRSRATVLVKVRFLELDPRVLPDMSARVAFLSRAPGPQDRQPRVVVQASAVVERAGGAVVYVVDGERVRERTLALGETLGDLRVVTQGLEPGERVVLAPPARMADGALVRPGEP